MECASLRLPPSLAKAKISKPSKVVAGEGPGPTGSWICLVPIVHFRFLAVQRDVPNKHQTTRDILVGKSFGFLGGSFFRRFSGAPAAGRSRPRWDGARLSSRSL